MLQSLIIIFAFTFGVQTSEVYDDKYSLSTTGSPEYVSGLEDAQNKCVDSWLLEIYDENVAKLLKKLNLNIQQNGILLGMKRGSNSWRWSDGRIFLGNIDNQSETTRVVACIGISNNQVQFFARTVFDSAAVICNKIATEDKCSEWFHNGVCYFKPATTTYKWFDAHNLCIKNGASMATFSNSETNFNMSFIGNQIYWVSLSRSTWVWTHSGADVTFNDWMYGQPDTNNNHYCAITNSNGKEWRLVDCRETFHIVCMRVNPSIDKTGYISQPPISTSTKTAIDNPKDDNHVVTTQTSLPTPRDNGRIINATKPANEESLSSGAKAGIGVGVSMLLIIIIIISGVLGFKHFQFKKAFQRKKSETATDPEDAYSVVANNNKQTISPDVNSHQLEYADLDFKKHFEDNIKSANY